MKLTVGTKVVIGLFAWTGVCIYGWHVYAQNKCNPNVTCGVMPGEIQGRSATPKRTGKFKPACIFDLEGGGIEISACPDMALAVESH
jgi:hypothetical protein